MKKLYSVLIISLLIVFSSFTIPLLNVVLLKYDLFNDNLEIGDDDMFNSNDFNVIHKGKIIKSLRDYDLKTAFHSEINKKDTLSLEIYFPGLKNNDTVIKIESINIYNGDRSSLENWKKSIKAKEIEIFYQNKCLGKACLFNSYKMQTIILNRSIPIVGNKKKYIDLVIKNTYTDNNKSQNYTLSEIGLEGLRLY